MKRRNVLIALCIIHLLFNFMLEAQTSWITLEEAIHAENTLGDLDQAIRINKSVLNDENSSPYSKDLAKNHLCRPH